MKKTLLIVLFVSIGLFANTLNDITSLIEQMKSVDPSQRYALMNEIKSNIITLNEADRALALNQMRRSRQEAKDKKLADMKASLTPQQLITFEEQIKRKKEKRARYKDKMSKIRNSLSDANIKKKNKHRKKKIRRPMTQKQLDKVKSQLTPDELNKYADKIKNYENLIKNVNRVQK